MAASRGNSSVRLVALTALWSTSLFLMVMGTFAPQVWWRWLAWGLWVGMAACVFTSWWIVDHAWHQRRNSVEHMAELLDDIERRPHVRPIR